MVKNNVELINRLTSEIKDLEALINRQRIANEILKLNIQKKQLNLSKLENEQ